MHSDSMRFLEGCSCENVSRRKGPIVKETCRLPGTPGLQLARPDLWEEGGAQQAAGRAGEGALAFQQRLSRNWGKRLSTRINLARANGWETPSKKQDDGAVVEGKPPGLRVTNSASTIRVLCARGKAALSLGPCCSGTVSPHGIPPPNPHAGGEHLSMCEVLGG